MCFKEQITSYVKGSLPAPPLCRLDRCLSNMGTVCRLARYSATASCVMTRSCPSLLAASFPRRMSKRVCWTVHPKILDASATVRCSCAMLLSCSELLLGLPVDSAGAQASAIMRPWETSQPLMSIRGGILRYYSAERRSKAGHWRLERSMTATAGSRALASGQTCQVPRTPTPISGRGQQESTCWRRKRASRRPKPIPGRRQSAGPGTPHPTCAVSLGICTPCAPPEWEPAATEQGSWTA